MNYPHDPNQPRDPRYPPWQGHQYGYAPQNQDTGLAVGSLICGLVGFMFLPLSVVAVILGHLARSKAHRGEASGAGMALAGLVLGYAVMGVVLALTLIFAFGLGEYSHH